MSQQGYLVWYSNADLDIDKTLVLRLAQLAGAETIDFVTCSNEAAHPFDEESRDSEELLSDVPVAELGKYLRPHQVMQCDADCAPFGTAISEAIEQQVPANIRGTFLPHRPFFSVGKSWWVDSDEMIEPVPCRVSFGCWGYSTPNDSDAMRRACADLAIVRRVQRQLEQFCPDVQVGMFWHF